MTEQVLRIPLIVSMFGYKPLAYIWSKLLILLHPVVTRVTQRDATQTLHCQDHKNYFNDTQATAPEIRQAFKTNGSHRTNVLDYFIRRDNI